MQQETLASMGKNMKDNLLSFLKEIIETGEKQHSYREHEKRTRKRGAKLCLIKSLTLKPSSPILRVMVRVTKMKLQTLMPPRSSKRPSWNPSTITWSRTNAAVVGSSILSEAVPSTLRVRDVLQPVATTRSADTYLAVVQWNSWP